MEKQGYRESLERLNTLFPDRISISPVEAASAMGKDVRTIRAWMSKPKNPLPSIKFSERCTVIPITELARFLSRGAR